MVLIRRDIRLVSYSCRRIRLLCGQLFGCSFCNSNWVDVVVRVTWLNGDAKMISLVSSSYLPIRGRNLNLGLAWCRI